MALNLFLVDFISYENEVYRLTILDNKMNKLALTVLTSAIALGLSGCAYVSDPLKQKESSASITEQQQAQIDAQKSIELAAPALKRKIALGRITNETAYGRSLLRVNDDNDSTANQVYTMFAKALGGSGQFMVLERSNLGALDREAALNGKALQQIGADVLVIGSLTEFGRKTVGSSGFLTTTKKQIAYAKMDVRIVDTSTGLVLFTASGAGEATTESGSVLGWTPDSHAGYDGTLSDKAIAQAVSEVVNKMVTGLANRPWKTYFLSTEPGAIAISGGASQGITPGMKLSVKARGKKVKSAQTGFLVELPGTEIAQIKVIQNFGDSPETEGSLVKVISGSIAKHKASSLMIEEIK